MQINIMQIYIFCNFVLSKAILKKIYIKSTNNTISVVSVVKFEIKLNNKKIKRVEIRNTRERVKCG